jgi:DNA-binding beta-propeller fold protein YncE
MLIDYVASQRVREVVASLGRTEDVKFSPSNRRIAVAQLWENKITVFDVSITASKGVKNVNLSGVTEFSSPNLNDPHGLDFIDDKKLVVANRKGEVCIFDLPQNSKVASEIKPVAIIRSDYIKAPGSVAVIRNGQASYETLICNNRTHCVTKHQLDRGAGFSSKHSEVLLKKWLNFPDGISVSTKKKWIAVSSHETHAVLLYEINASLNASSDPVGILRLTNYPHGVRFTSDDRFILVADGGSPYVNIYGNHRSDWRGVRDPLLSFRVLEEDEFLRGHYNSREGGPKGIDINSDANVLVTTCQSQPLRFYDLDAILNELSTARVAQSEVGDPNCLTIKRPYLKIRGVTYELYRQRITAAVTNLPKLPRRAFRWVSWRVYEAWTKKCCR